MNASKFLVSAATAIAVVGAAGFAYAQTTSPSTSATSDPQTQNPAPMTNGTTPARPDTMTRGTTDANGQMNSGSTGAMNRNSTGTTRGMNNANGMRSNDAAGTMGHGEHREHREPRSTHGEIRNS